VVRGGVPEEELRRKNSLALERSPRQRWSLRAPQSDREDRCIWQVNTSELYYAYGVIVVFKLLNLIKTLGVWKTSLLHIQVSIQKVTIER
jgi:hypothetical protein